jgi:phosphate transport system substrate-binding protein
MMLKTLVIIILTLTGAATAAEIEVIGAGASFPAPAIESWARQYSENAGVRLLYRSVGSGEGIRRVTARSADFAMTDVPLTQAELNQDDLLQFPVVAGAIAPVVNLPAELRLTGTQLADIYLGKIANWRAIDASLPDLPITVVHRAEGSGTSFVFTYYLSGVSEEWASRLGIGSRLIWPAGIAASGNEGVAQAVQEKPGAIGYVELAYAVKHNLATAAVRNRAGQFVKPSDAAVGAALAASKWSRPGFYEVAVDRGGEASWPIVGVSFALIHKRQEARADAAATMSFFAWIHAHPNQPDYVTLSDAMFEAGWDQVKDEHGQPVWKRK